jgi:CRISPR type I-E-associated protein CasA/Cse1
MTERLFHVLRDPWIPLDRNGHEELASFVELLTGKKDAPDLWHPRDDLRFFARMLLASLVQALFEPKNEEELEERIARPMTRKELEGRIAEVEDDFWLVHPKARSGFLQTGKVPAEKKKPGCMSTVDVT